MHGNSVEMGLGVFTANNPKKQQEKHFTCTNLSNVGNHKIWHHRLILKKKLLV